jgi:RNA polymerase sigma factor (sigma-70 family)
MGNFTEAQIIEGLHKGDEKVIKYLYQSYFPMVKFIVGQQHGTYEQSVEIFHESVLVLLMKLQRPEFRLQCAVKTYLFAVAKNLWLQNLERRSRHIPFQDKEDQIAHEEETPYEDDSFLKQRILQRQFLRLPPRCQRLIHLFLKGLSFDDLTREMGFKSKKYTIKRKYECMKKLQELVASDPEYEDAWGN